MTTDEMYMYRKSDERASCRKTAREFCCQSTNGQRLRPEGLMLGVGFLRRSSYHTSQVSGVL